LKPPISRDPLGRDHFWFSRPVDSNANSEALFYYLYGSDGPEQDNPWKVHHGIDLPNCLGEPVRAAGSGTVIWASDGLRVDDGIFENSPSYGNVVQIEHDFGYQGQKIYTVYAHLSAALVERGQRVEAEEVIGLVGDSGRASGPHVHFEVRIGEISQYRATYNPVLWMAPFVDHGVIAGRIVDARGSLIQDLPVTIRNWATGLVETTTTSYVLLDRADDVNPDPAWRENFAAGDIPVGRYQIIANINGERVSELVDVLEGATTFVELKPSESTTPQPATPES
jgi:murein DD-endopeptidase MepM/ murein hydrolase activator NlpD